MELPEEMKKLMEDGSFLAEADQHKAASIDLAVKDFQLEMAHRKAVEDGDGETADAIALFRALALRSADPKIVAGALLAHSHLLGEVLVQQWGGMEATIKAMADDDLPLFPNTDMGGPSVLSELDSELKNKIHGKTPYCPTCGKQLDGYVEFQDRTATPHDEDYSICAGCHTILRFVVKDGEDTYLRVQTSEEQEESEQDDRIKVALALIKARGEFSS